jgi:hypothetical protein
MPGVYPIASGPSLRPTPARLGDGPGRVQVGGYPVVMAKFSKGDKVTWKSHGGEAVGEVEEEITSDTEAAGRTVRASEEDPQYLVRSEKSGGEAVHKPSALHKEKK